MEAAQAVVEPQTLPEAEQRKKPKRQPRYHVILWNDDDHSYQYVIDLAQSLFGHPPEKGFKIAEEVHHRGRAILLTTTMEHAELKRDQVHAFGKDGLIGNCQGSMWSTIEAEVG